MKGALLAGIWLLVLAVWPFGAVDRAATLARRVSATWPRGPRCGTPRPFAWWVSAHAFAERRGWSGRHADRTHARAGRAEVRERARRATRDRKVPARRSAEPEPPTDPWDTLLWAHPDGEPWDALGHRLLNVEREWTHPDGGVRCELCGRMVRTRQGLEQHMRACHGDE